VGEWFFQVSRLDPADVIQEKLLLGQKVLNYGLYFLYRRQDFGYASAVNKTPVGVGSSVADLSKAFLERNAWMVIPDFWIKFMWRKLTVEFEGAIRGGKIGNANLDLDTVDPVTILQFGWALRSQYRFLHDTLFLGLEMGMASGDQDEPANADINVRRTNPVAYDTDRRLHRFSFDPDYHVDLILFRQLLNGVSNAIYFKPSIEYDLVQTFGARLGLIYSLAHEPTGYPGNSQNLGMELDLDLFYRNVDEKFYTGLQYGVLFPLGAFDRPAEIYGSTLGADASTAQTLRWNVVVKF
jgi:uncharacterized protein (TIGR04551 family)